MSLDFLPNDFNMQDYIDCPKKEFDSRILVSIPSSHLFLSVQKYIQLSNVIADSQLEIS